MAVTDEKSTQVARSTAFPPSQNPVHEWRARVRHLYFSFTQSAAPGDAGSSQMLVTLPQGHVRVFPALSMLKRSAFGAARTLDIGVTAHKKPDGTTVAAVVDSILDGLDVAAAGAAAMATGTNVKPESFLVENGNGAAQVKAIVAGGTIPAAATLEGYIAYSLD